MKTLYAKPTTLTLSLSQGARGKTTCFSLVLLCRKALTIMVIFFAGTTLAGGWYWEVGAAGRSTVKLEMRSDSYARMLGLQAARPGSTSTSHPLPDSPLLPDSLGPGSRYFEDGTVATDAMSFWFGNTENWSFDSMSQYDSTAQTLTFHTSSDSWTGITAVEDRRSVSSQNAGILRDDDDDSQFGIEAKVGYYFYEKEKLKLGWQGAIRVFGESEASLGGTAFRQTIVNEQFATTTTLQEHWSYIYDADFGGPQLIAPRPAGTTGAPYLPVTPIGRNLDSVDETTESSLISRTVRHAQSDVRMKTELQLTQLALGPTFELSLPRGFVVGLSPYLTLNILDFSATHREVFGYSSGERIASYHKDTDETEIVLGAGIDTYLGYEFIQSWMGVVTFGYEDTFEDATLNVGPGKVKADLASCRFSIGVRHAF